MMIMFTSHTRRVSRADIFIHLDVLLGHEALTIVTQTVQQLEAGDGRTALTTLQAYDATIGDMGLHDFKGEKLPGAYRAISYVAMVILRPDPEDFSRHIIASSCEHVEAVLKRLAKLNLFESMRDDLTMGALLHKLKKDLPPVLYTDLHWLRGILNSVKHENDFSDDPEPEPEHFFDLDEAVAIYLIARRLVVQLQNHFHKSTADLAWYRGS